MPEFVHFALEVMKFGHLLLSLSAVKHGLYQSQLCERLTNYSLVFYRHMHLFNYGRDDHKSMKIDI